MTAASFSVRSADYAVPGFLLGYSVLVKKGEKEREKEGELKRVCCKPFHGWLCLIPGDRGNNLSVFNPEPLESSELVALSREGRERLLWTLPSWGQESPVDQKCPVGVRELRTPLGPAVHRTEVKSKGTAAGCPSLSAKQLAARLQNDHRGYCSTGGAGRGRVWRGGEGRAQWGREAPWEL